MSYKVDKDLAEILGNDAEVAEYTRKKVKLEQHSLDTRYQQLEDQKEELVKFQSFDLRKNRSKIVAELGQEITEYLVKAKESKVFLNDAFKGKVPFFARNIILIGAETGRGKSTITANLILNASMQKQKTLVISNEENSGDVYNRVTCLYRGWSYTNQETFTREQIDVLSRSVAVLDERVTVIGDTYDGMTGCTTTIEGIEMILKHLLETQKENPYDLIILDYYQNVDRSVKYPLLNEYQVQYKLTKMLDQFKNIYGAPIVVLAQKKPSHVDKKLPFKDAIEGRKTIINVSTCALDVNIDSERLLTSFTIMKSRFNGCIGETIDVGFDRGRYVDYSSEFKLKTNMNALAKSQAQLMSKVKTTNFNSESE